MGLSSVLSLYHSRGLTVSQINCDNEFACVRDSFLPIAFNVVAAEEHVGDVERSIRTSKHHTRSLIHDLPFSSYPREMIIGAVVSAMRKRNSLPNLRGISPHLSPSSLVTGEAAPDYHLVSTLDFGDYVHIYEGTSNKMEPRTQPAIALYPSGNLTGGWFFMSLLTGKSIHRRQYTILPAGNDVVTRMHTLAQAEKQPSSANGFLYEWSPGHPLSSLSPLDILAEAPDLHANQGALPHTNPGAQGAQEAAPLHYTNQGAQAPTNAEAQGAPPSTGAPPLPNTNQGAHLPPPPPLPMTSTPSPATSDVHNTTIMLLPEPDPLILPDDSVQEDTDAPLNPPLPLPADEDSNIIDENNFIPISTNPAPNTHNNSDTPTSPATMTSPNSPSPPSHHMALRTRAPVDYLTLNRRGQQQHLHIHNKPGQQQNKTHAKLRDTFRQIVGIVIAHVKKSTSEHDQLNVDEGIK